VVLGETDNQHGGLVDEVRVEVLTLHPALGAWRAESARSRFVTRLRMSGSSPVTSAAMAR
jgi:hypothetical protein